MAAACALAPHCHCALATTSPLRRTCKLTAVAAVIEATHRRGRGRHRWLRRGGGCGGGLGGGLCRGTGKRGGGGSIERLAGLPSLAVA